MRCVGLNCLAAVSQLAYVTKSGVYQQGTFIVTASFHCHTTIDDPELHV